MIKTIDITNITDEMIEVAAGSAQLRAMAGVTEHDALIRGSILAALIVAPAVEPAQAVPYGWHITGLSCLMVGEYAEHDAKAAAKRCGGTTKAIPLYTAPPAIDDETRQRTLDFVRWIASLKTGGLIQARANDLLSMLEAGNE